MATLDGRDEEMQIWVLFLEPMSLKQVSAIFIWKHKITVVVVS